MATSGNCAALRLKTNNCASRSGRCKTSCATRGNKSLKPSGSKSFWILKRRIARDPSMWFDNIVINKGRWSGVEVNMAVVAPGGIVGRVVSTSPWSAQVMLITNEKSGAGAVVGQLGQSSALGSIKGLGENGLLEMRYVSALEKVEVGDLVLTTGQDGIYPSGYNVGAVVEANPGSATQTQAIRIRPTAGLDRLKEVAVLLYHPPQRTESDQALPNVEKKKSK
ncbi:MAG: rod shape-determining protein MreC [Acidobacteria bacterium]|nr:MAG: rod shape-determining protein MreC [Acidobacteriota bacterium]